MAVSGPASGHPLPDALELIDTAREAVGDVDDLRPGPPVRRGAPSRPGACQGGQGAAARLAALPAEVAYVDRGQLPTALASALLLTDATDSPRGDRGERPSSCCATARRLLTERCWCTPRA